MPFPGETFSGSHSEQRELEQEVIYNKGYFQGGDQGWASSEAGRRDNSPNLQDPSQHLPGGVILPCNCPLQLDRLFAALQVISCGCPRAHPVRLSGSLTLLGSSAQPLSKMDSRQEQQQPLSLRSTAMQTDAAWALSNCTYKAN